jgi:hypothetical protein
MRNTLVDQISACRTWMRNTLVDQISACRTWMRNTLVDQISACRIVFIYKIFLVVIKLSESLQ